MSKWFSRFVVFLIVSLLLSAALSPPVQTVKMQMSLSERAEEADSVVGTVAHLECPIEGAHLYRPNPPHLKGPQEASRRTSPSTAHGSYSGGAYRQFHMRVSHIPEFQLRWLSEQIHLMKHPLPGYRVNGAGVRWRRQRSWFC